MIALVPYVVAVAVGFVVGLLVGRKHPSVANTAADLANKAQSAVEKK